MERIDTFSQSPSQNQIIVDPAKSSLTNSHIIFEGTGNILFVEDGVYLHNSTLSFHNNNSVVYLSKNWYKYFLNLHVYEGNCIYIGTDCYFNGPMNILAGEGQNILIGNDSLFSFGVCLKTTDGHLVFSIEDMRRTNFSKSILIGDHVWFGQQTTLLKGTVVGSGAIIGACAVVSNKQLPSNTAWSGNPARQIRQGVFFSKELTPPWTAEQTERSKIAQTQTGIYQRTPHSKDIRTIDTRLKCAQSTEEKIRIIQEALVEDQSKDRFYIGENAKSVRPRKWSLFR